MSFLRRLPGLVSHSRPLATCGTFAPRFFAAAAVPVDKLRNVAIIAHVDHGKTTLVDQLLKQTQGLTQGSMDCNELESERGITILSKSTRLFYKDHVLNIVDTPGHADFGGEVERVMSMVDGVVLVVDLVEGPRTQTTFVLKKALQVKHIRPMIVVNKVDRPSDRGKNDIDNEVFDLFCQLDASDEQMEYPTMYGSAKEGWCVQEFDDHKVPEKRLPMSSVLDMIIKHVQPPAELKTEENGSKFSMLVTTIEHVTHAGLGLTATGKIYSGQVKKGDRLLVKNRFDKRIGWSKVRDVTVMKNLERSSVGLAGPGDIVSITFADKSVSPNVTDTICGHEDVVPLKSIDIDPPVIAVKISCNTSPLSGQDGKLISQEAITKRLKKEGVQNVGIEVTETPNRDAMEVRGRGELQLAILVEQMRREGFEMTLSPPSILHKMIDGVEHEPWEEIHVILGANEANLVMEKMSMRGAEVVNMTDMAKDGTVSIHFLASTKAFVGMRAFVRDITRGQGIVSSTFSEWRKKTPPLPASRNGVLLSKDQGEATVYDLNHMVSHGNLFVKDKDRVYPGMILGEAHSDKDLIMVSAKGKELTDCRRKAKEDKVSLPPPRRMGIEDALSFIQEDEQIEITPQRVAMRKKILDPTERKAAERQRLKEMSAKA